MSIEKEKITKARIIIREAFDCVDEMIGLGDTDSRVELDFSIRLGGIGVNVNVFEYDI